MTMRCHRARAVVASRVLTETAVPVTPQLIDETAAPQMRVRLPGSLWAQGDQLGNAAKCMRLVATSKVVVRDAIGAVTLTDADAELRLPIAVDGVNTQSRLEVVVGAGQGQYRVQLPARGVWQLPPTPDVTLNLIGQVNQSGDGGPVNLAQERLPPGTLQRYVLMEEINVALYEMPLSAYGAQRVRLRDTFRLEAPELSPSDLHWRFPPNVTSYRVTMTVGNAKGAGGIATAPSVGEVNFNLGGLSRVPYTYLEGVDGWRSAVGLQGLVFFPHGEAEENPPGWTVTVETEAWL